MNDAVKAMLKQFGPVDSILDEDNALKEIIQYISLLGLHRASFFDKAAFYGGTALRVLHAMERFSEDMDFCLMQPDPQFTLKPYLPKVKQELERFGFHAEISEKRTGPGAEIESAFVKQPTQEALLVIEKDPERAHKGQLIKVRIEVDKHNPPGAEPDLRLVKLPVPFMVRTLTLPSLFAGKLHAVIARAYLDRVKGRDYFDLQFYLARDIPVNTAYLEAKLRQSGHFAGAEPLTGPKVLELLRTRIAAVDFAKAKADVMPFVKGSVAEMVQDWSPELFTALAETIRCE